MKIKKITLTVIMIFGYLLASNWAVISAQSSPYWYTFRSRDSAGSLVKVDPANPSNRLEFMVDPSAGVESISPDGVWMIQVFRVSGEKENEIRLVNMLTNETRVVGRFGRAIASNTAYTYDEFYWWSPNSQYVAFRARATMQNGYTYNIAYLYNIQASQLIDLVSDNHQAGFIAWSPNSDKLAVVVRHCKPTERCTNGTEIFNVLSNVTERSIEFDQTFVDSIAKNPSPDEAFCALLWSPSMTKLLFKANCGSSFYYYKELNVVDLTTGVIQRLTYHTPLASENGNEYNYNIRQTATWVDDNTLLVSYNRLRSTQFQENSQVRGAAVERYQLSQGTVSILEEGVFVQQWAKRPSADVYATSRLTINPNNADALPAPTLLVSPTANGLSTDQSLPAGCNFEWDPTGTYLAYTPLDGADCSRVSPTVRHVIYNTQTGQSVAVEGVGTPLGWVAVQ